MKIYSMTATFGKLQQQTLSLQPGLNVIQAPNEWGKSTWCAFLTAMFYGLDTRAHSTKTALSDKERYAPWSGAPMSGRIDLNWKGRDITIERKTKGRVIFGDFRAYETASGLSVPELTAQNCGQQLLGVEKTVFTRSALIRLTDLPVTQDEALRRRLNALVTTGDDSGQADALERRLRELKNRCRYNRTGLLPQTEAEMADLDRKLGELELLESRSRQLRQRSADLERSVTELENHRAALAYQAAEENARHRQHSQAALEAAASELKMLETQLAQLPGEAQARQTLAELQHLQQRWAQLPLESAPAHTSHLFRDLSTEEAMAKVTADGARYRKLCRLPVWWLLPLFALCAGITLLFLPEYAVAGYCFLGTGLFGGMLWAISIACRQRKANAIADFYGSKDPAAWIRLARDYGDQAAATASHQASVEDLRHHTEALCQGHPLTQAIAYWQDICGKWDALHAARKEWAGALERFAIVKDFPTDAPAPQYPDKLTLSPQQTQTALLETATELRQLQLHLGQCQGQMEAIGHRTVLESRKAQLSKRIRNLEDTYAALEIALSTLEQARNVLQRRFAPRITARAQEILRRLTDGRYTRLVLAEDLTLQTNTLDEDTLRTALWRSDGTADLLYLALRLAVSGELTPEAPLILDDALVRFDDRRLQRAMEALEAESGQRQIILFTCHSRESQYMKKKEL